MKSSCTVEGESNHSSFIVSDTAMLQMRLAGAYGAKRAVNRRSASIPAMNGAGSCHAVPQ